MTDASPVRSGLEPVGSDPDPSGSGSGSGSENFEFIGFESGSENFEFIGSESGSGFDNFKSGSVPGL